MAAAAILKEEEKKLAGSRSTGHSWQTLAEDSRTPAENSTTITRTEANTGAF